MLEGYDCRVLISVVARQVCDVRTALLQRASSPAKVALFALSSRLQGDGDAILPQKQILSEVNPLEMLEHPWGFYIDS